MRLLVLALVCMLPCACDDAQGPSAETAAPSASSAPPSAIPTGSAAPAKAKEIPPVVAAGTAAKKDYPCGDKDEPPCPMQGWMKSHIAKSIARADTKALAEELAFIARHPVEGYDDWTKIAEEGVAAAKADDLPGAKASCKRCHKTYQRRYKAERRDAPWPE